MYAFGQMYSTGKLTIGDEHQMTHCVRDALISWRMQRVALGVQHSEPRLVAIVGCARGEKHELGALMVRLTLEESGWKVIYLGDTADKMAYFDRAALEKLGVDIEDHGKMPDVVIHHVKKNWLLLIEAVTSHGSVDPKIFSVPF